MQILVDADACPVKSEIMRVAGRRGVPVVMVSDGGVRPSAFPSARMVYVPEGPDAADDWIVSAISAGDVCVTGDIPLAARVIAAQGRVLTHAGEELSARNIGARLAQRNLMTDLRSAHPLQAGGSGRSFSKADRSRFLQALDRVCGKRP